MGESEKKAAEVAWMTDSQLPRTFTPNRKGLKAETQSSERREARHLEVRREWTSPMEMGRIPPCFSRRHGELLRREMVGLDEEFSLYS